MYWKLRAPTTRVSFFHPRISGKTTFRTMNFVGALFSGLTRCMASIVDLLEHVTWDDTSYPLIFMNVRIKILPFARGHFSKNGSIFHCHVCLRECEIGKKSGSKCRDTMWKKTVMNIIQLFWVSFQLMFFANLTISIETIHVLLLNPHFSLGICSTFYMKI